MTRNAFDAIERQHNEAEDYRATVKQERALDLAEKRIAELEYKAAIYDWLVKQFDETYCGWRLYVFISSNADIQTLNDALSAYAGVKK